jgi:hypothetical protein
MSEHTPKTEQVRRYWQYGSNAWLAESADDRDPDGLFGAEFDRWLTAHDAEVKAEAWDEGYKTCDQVWVQTADITTPDEYRTDPRNPYREIVE